MNFISLVMVNGVNLIISGDIYQVLGKVVIVFWLNKLLKVECWRGVLSYTSTGVQSEGKRILKMWAPRSGEVDRFQTIPITAPVCQFHESSFHSTREWSWRRMMPGSIKGKVGCWEGWALPTDRPSSIHLQCLQTLIKLCSLGHYSFCRSYVTVYTLYYLYELPQSKEFILFLASRK